MRKQPKKIGLAIVGAGRVGLIRGELAARHPEVEWIGIAEKNPERAKLVAGKIGAEFVTADFRELLQRPEVNAAVISTDEHLHVDPVLAGVARGLPMMIEKPLATDLAESQMVMDAIEKSKRTVHRYSTSPIRTATMAAWVLSETPNLPMTLWTCFLTVTSARLNSTEIALLPYP